jgi:Ca2+-binding EF-hand superfamily protein
MAFNWEDLLLTAMENPVPSFLTVAVLLGTALIFCLSRGSKKKTPSTSPSTPTPSLQTKEEGQKEGAEVKEKEEKDKEKTKKINDEEIKEDFDRKFPPDPLARTQSHPTSAAPAVPSPVPLTKSSSIGDKPSEEFDKQKILAELAQSNPHLFRRHLLTHLDELNGKDVDSTIEEIFNSFDVDKNGILEGDEYAKCIRQLAEHMHREMEEVMETVFNKMAKDLDMSKDEVDVVRNEHNAKNTVESFEQEVISLVDADGDGKITLEEAKEGFHKVVDKIESKR